MPDTPDIPRPSQLWKRMAPDRRMQAAEAFWRDENANTEQGEAIATIAQRIKFRPKSVMSLSVEKKARYLVSLAGLSELVAARLLVAYHLERQRPMMASFLDALGIGHEEGIIAGDDIAPPDPAALRAAAASLAGAYPAEEVALYLSTLVWQDPDTWGPLGELPEVQAAIKV